MEHLPTDEEYLEVLRQDLEDPEWIAFQKQMSTSVDPVAVAHEYVKQGAFTQERFDDLVKAISESTNPDLYFRGSYIDLLRNVALGGVKTHSEQLKNIPVACLPTRTLNAGAYRTPRGGAVILLDAGVILNLALLVRSYIAFYTWRTPHPYCKDHSQPEFAETIIHLAAFCVSRDLKHLQKITTWKCPSLPMHDELMENFSFMIELFIMLHEFGHVVLNHLSQESPTMLTGSKLAFFTNSQMQEFEADAFAFHQYCSLGARGSDVAFAAGLLLNFFHLCETLAPPIIQTHPPARERWHRIKQLAHLADYPARWANYIDGAFAVLSSGLHPL